MALLSGPFRKKTPRDPEILARIRGWCLEALGGEESTELTISEVDCPDPTCPGLETFILVMRRGEAMQATKIRKPLADIVEADVIEALKYL